MSDLRQILDKFSTETTVHGLPKVIRSRSKAARMLWIFAGVTAIIVCSAQFAQLFKKYYSYPKKVTIEVVTSHVPFPAISLCNMRNLDTTVLNEMNRVFNSLGNDSMRMEWNTYIPFVDAYMKLLSKYFPMFYHRRDIKIHIFQGVLSRTTIATNIDRNLVVSAGIPQKEFIVSCQYGGNDCSNSGTFEQFFDPYYYNCYTYNSMEMGTDEDMLPEGLENGWSSVVLTGSGMLDRNEDVRMIPGTHELHSPQASNEGVRVVLHPPNSQPFPHTEGFDVPPGHSVSFGLRPHETVRIGPPHGNCTGDANYRLIECQKHCVQAGVIQKCGCKSIYLPIKNRTASDSVRYCSDDFDIPLHCATNITDECIEKLYEFFNRMECARETAVQMSKNATLARSCGCFPPCYELGYDVTYSLSKWPAQSFHGEEAHIDIFHNVQYLSRFASPDEKTKYDLYSSYFHELNRHQAMQDFARLNVYIADSNVIKTIETEDYQTSQLLSDIGGQLGLWIGISVISLCELCELFLDMLGYATKTHVLKTSKSVKTMDYDVHVGSSHCRDCQRRRNTHYNTQYYAYRMSEPNLGNGPLLMPAAPTTPDLA